MRRDPRFSPFTAKRRGSPCAPWTFVAMWLVAKATPAVWVVNAEVWSRRRLQRFCGSLGLRRGLRPSRAATGPRPRGSNAPRRPACRIAGLVVASRDMDASVRGTSSARALRGSRSSLGAFPPARNAAHGRASAAAMADDPKRAGRRPPGHSSKTRWASSARRTCSWARRWRAATTPPISRWRALAARAARRAARGESSTRLSTSHIYCYIT